MKLKSLIVTLVGLCIIKEVSSTFNLCGHNEGVDVCNACNKNKGITAPRPYPNHAPRIPAVPLIKTICKHETVQGPKPFNPIGDACNCGKQIVKPAPLPNIRPSCLPSLPQLSFHKPSCSCAACNIPSSSPASSDCGHPVRAPEQYQVYNNDGATIYLEPSKKHSTAPPKHRYGQADVVSVAIARQLANKAKNSISEKQLQYGSLKEPKIPEKSSKKVVQNIKEESFYETKGDVLEIQSNLFHRKPISSESESSEEEEKQNKKKVEVFHPAQLKYDDIGFAAYKPSQKPRYVVVKNKHAKHDCPHSTRRPHRHNHFRKESSCDCYKDLVVDQSEISEQSLSYENASDQQMLPRGRLST